MPIYEIFVLMSFWHKTLKNGTNFRCPAVWHAQGQMTETWRNSIVCSKFSILQVGLPLWAGPVLRGTGPMGLPIACNLSEILQRGHYLDNSIHGRTDVQLYTVHNSISFPEDLLFSQTRRQTVPRDNIYNTLQRVYRQIPSLGTMTLLVILSSSAGKDWF